MNNLKKFSIIGVGKMGSSIVRATLNQGYQITAYDVTSNKSLRSDPNLIWTDSIDEFLKIKNPLIIAVKPTQVFSILKKIKDDRLLISIAAGLSHSQLKSYRIKSDGKEKGQGHVIRAMPNTPLQVGEGMTVLFSKDADIAEMEFTNKLFSSVGLVHIIENEDWMHSVTALSGSGPAFVYLFIQAMEDAGVKHGLPRELARKLAVQTVSGGAKLLRNSEKSPQELIHEVTSPGGTTIAGIGALKDHSFEAAIWDAITSATYRSMELQKNESIS